MVAPLGTILIVDDDQVFRETIGSGLEKQGYKIFTATGGRQAFEIVKTQPIDVVITDIDMADGNGAVLLENIKRLPESNIFVLFMVDISDVSLEQAYDIGVEAVFIKPFKLKDLANHLDVILKAENKDRLRTPSRFKVGRGVEIGAVEVSSGESVVLQDIGVGGFSVTNPKKMPQLNEVIPFNIQLSGDLFIFFKGTGIVRWTKPGTAGTANQPSFGIEFLEFDRANSLKASELINFLKTKQLIPMRQ